MFINIVLLYRDPLLRAMVNLVLTHENEVLFLDNRGVEVLLAILRGNNTCISILFLNLIKLVIIDIRFQ